MEQTNPADRTENRALVRRPKAETAVYGSYGALAGYGFEAEFEGDSGAELLRFWNILRQRKGVILTSALAGLLLGGLVGVPMQPVYRAEISLEVLNLNEDFLNAKQTNPIASNSSSTDTPEEQTEAKLMESAALVDRVKAKLDSDKGAAPESVAQWRAKQRRAPAATGWRHWLHLPEKAKLSGREKLIEQAAASLKIRSMSHTRLIEATVDSRDPQLAADFVNLLASERIQQNQESKLDTGQRTEAWLKHELAAARENLRSSENALQNYARTSGLIFLDEGTNVATEKLQEVQQELSAATADRIAKQSRLELARSSPPGTLADVLNDLGLRETEGKLNDAKRRLADLTAVYNSGYSKVRQAQGELAALETVFARQRGNILRRIENDYEDAKRRERLLEATYDGQTREVSGQGEKAVQYNILKREVESNRQLYDTMLQQMKQAAIASAMRASNVRVVDEARVPDIPIAPDFKLNAAFGLLAGLVSSCLVATLADLSDRTLRQPGDVRRWTELPELGTIPNAGAGAKLPARKQPGRFALQFNGKESNLVAEAFRSALASILFSGGSTDGARLLVFTSADEGDGKTTVVSNLAIATAELRKKVLVIDADLRRPRQHELFQLVNGRGLSNLLLEEFGAETLGAVVRETGTPGLHVITSGPATQSAGHLLASPNFAVMLAKLKSDYDLILIDTPPMLEMSDARLVGALADSVILVAHAARTSRDALQAVSERFREDGRSVLGVILNNWDPRQSRSAHYRYGKRSRYTRYSERGQPGLA
jgi:succinoglycan biosynthesis transport protein ExoP